MRTFTHLWQQDHLSDCDIVLAAQQHSSGDRVCQLLSFPGHTVLLDHSPFFSAQILRWQKKRQHEDDTPAQEPDDQTADPSTQPRRSTRQRSSTACNPQQDQEQQQITEHQEGSGMTSPASSSSRRPKLVLTLEDADHQLPALAVLQVLYLIQTESGLLSELTQEQQLQAALLADMWQVPDAATAAVSRLAAVADEELSQTVMNRLISMQAVPGCLEPLLKKVLLLLLGDLEAVWADTTLQEQLLGLPLHAMKLLLSCDELKESQAEAQPLFISVYTLPAQTVMKLLLSCDELKVASEDTVMFTVQQYVQGKWEDPASLQLLQLVRCPRLSNYWLTAMAAPTHPNCEVFPKLLPKLTILHTAHIIVKDYQLMPYRYKKLFADAPASWAMPMRALSPVDNVQMIWELPIDKLRKAAQRSVANNAVIKLHSPSTTPPFNGIRYLCRVHCQPKDGSCCVGVWVGARLPAALWMPVDLRVEVPGTAFTKQVSITIANGNFGHGWSDYFKLPGMAGGWDEAAWAAKGLPTSGTLPIKLTVFE